MLIAPLSHDFQTCQQKRSRLQRDNGIGQVASAELVALALALLDEKLRTNPDLYPSEEEQKRLHLPKALDQKALKLWSQAWDRAKGLR